MILYELVFDESVSADADSLELAKRLQAAVKLLKKHKILRVVHPDYSVPANDPLSNFEKTPANLYVIPSLDTTIEPPDLSL